MHNMLGSARKCCVIHVHVMESSHTASGRALDLRCVGWLPRELSLAAMCMQLACARIGAVHSVVFAGFSAESLAGRLLDSTPSIILTASAVMRAAKPIALKVRCCI